MVILADDTQRDWPVFFVVDKPRLQRIIAIVRDDRSKRSQWHRGPFLRLEAQDDYLKLDGIEASAKFPATVYESGVLFLKVTLFRKLLRSITGEKFLSIQVADDELLMEQIRMPLHENEMLLYAHPDQAPQHHPTYSKPDLPPEPKDMQKRLWSRFEEDDCE